MASLSPVVILCCFITQVRCQPRSPVQADPFAAGQVAVQVSCADAAVPCNDTCGWVNWITLFNSTTATKPMMKLTNFKGGDKSCFRKCFESSKCSGFSFIDEACHLYSVINPSDVTNSTGKKISLTLVDSGSMTILGEWIFSRDVTISTDVTAYRQLPSQDWVSCLRTCIQTEAKNCRAVSFSYHDSGKECSLFDVWNGKKTYFRRNAVTIQHVDVFKSRSLKYRFTGYSGLIPNLTSAAYTTSLGSAEECFSTCFQDPMCVMVTIEELEKNGVDCQVYYKFGVFDLQPNPSAISYLLTVPQNNSLYYMYSSNALLEGTALKQGKQTSLIACLDWARNNLQIRFAYDANTRDCSLLPDAVNLITSSAKTKSEKRYYEVALPEAAQTYLSFQHTWLRNPEVITKGISDDITNGTILYCSYACLTMDSCAGFLMQHSAGQKSPISSKCIFLNNSMIIPVYTSSLNTPPTSKLTLELYIKKFQSYFLSKLISTTPTCFPKAKRSVGVADFLGEAELENIRDKLPDADSKDLPPNGKSFDGVEEVPKQNMASVPTANNEEVKSKCAKSKAKHKREKRDVPIELMPLLPRVAGAVAKAAPIVTQVVAPLVETAATASSIPVVGWVVGGLLLAGAAIAAIGCAIKWCQPDKKDERPTCARARSLLHERIFDANGSWEKTSARYKRQPAPAPDPRCTCFRQPNADRMVDEEDALHDDCTNGGMGRPLNAMCHICCKAGYSAQDQQLTCTGDTVHPAEWHPDPLCEPVACTVNAAGMALIPVSNCLGSFYYGVSYDSNRRLPNYAVYFFGDNNAAGVGRDGTFSAYPCPELQRLQLTSRNYLDLGGNIFNKGHLAPNGDFNFLLDSQQSTFFYINAAPQDAYSNQAAVWGRLEKRVKAALSANIGGVYRKGFVLTGVCPTNRPHPSNPALMLPIPECFWKVVCTRSNTGILTSALYYHTNSYVDRNNAAQKMARYNEVFIQPVREQTDLQTLANINIGAVWDEAEIFFQNEDAAVRSEYAQCKHASATGTPVRSSVAEELKEFWRDFLFGDGFVPDFTKNDEKDVKVDTSNSGAPPNCAKRVIAYVSSWKDVPFKVSQASYYTHVVFAFVEMTGDGSLRVGSADAEHSASLDVDTKKSYIRLYEIKTAKEAIGASQGRTLYTQFAVGGWENSQFYSATAASSTATGNFIASALQIIDYFNMDGIDIDWEYPVTGGKTSGPKSDRENYLKFLSSIRSALTAHQNAKGRGEPYLLSIAGAAGSWVLDDGYDLMGIMDSVDWINVMTYDYFGAWDSKWGTYTGPHSPLYFGAPKGYSGKTNADYTMKYYTCRSEQQGKLNIGLGFYGRFWNHTLMPENPKYPVFTRASVGPGGKADGGFVGWREIKQDFLAAGSGYEQHYDALTETPYLTKGDFLLGYENPRSIQAKVQYAASKDIGGVMIWAADLDDDEYTLTRTASSSQLCGAGQQDLGIAYKCTPITERRWWIPEDEDGKKAGMCGKTAPLFKGYYPVCDPEDPGYGCCSPAGYCGSEENFCKCDGCVDYYDNPEQVLEDPIKPSGPIRWHTLDEALQGPYCGYEGKRLTNGELAICNPDSNSAYCCSSGGYCGKGSEFCDCSGCINFKKIPNFKYPPKTWIESTANAGKCGYNPDLSSNDLINGNLPTCNSLSDKYYCCSTSGYCGSGNDFCAKPGSVNFKNNPNYKYPLKTWIDSGADAGKCGKNAQVNGQKATCYPYSDKYYCCSASGFCGNGKDYCDCNGCVNYKRN